MTDIVSRINCFLRDCAPHVRKRATCQMLECARDEIVRLQTAERRLAAINAELRDALDTLLDAIPSHGDDCELICTPTLDGNKRDLQCDCAIGSAKAAARAAIAKATGEA